MDRKLRQIKFLLYISWGLATAGLLARALLPRESRQAVGKVQATHGVTVDGSVVRVEDVVFSGDSVTTAKSASALVTFSPFSKSNVLEDSSVRFLSGGAGHPLAQISSGTVLTSTGAGMAAAVETDRYRVEPAEGGKAIFLVALLPDKTAVVAARRSSVSVTEIRSGDRYILKEGFYAVIEPSALGVPPQEKEETKPAPPKPAGQEAPPAAAPPAQEKESPKQAHGKGKEAAQSTTPKKGAWHIGSLSPASSVAVVGASVGGVAAIIAAAGAGGSSASPSSP